MPRSKASAISMEGYFTRSPSRSIQRRFVRAAMRYRHEQRRIVERAAELYDLPTRSEIDALAQRVHTLERENRALKRRLEAGARPRRSKA